MDIEQFRKHGYQAVDRICDYYYSLESRPVASSVEPGYLRKCLPASAPEAGEDFQLIADDYQTYIMPGLTHWQHPSFFAYFPTACTFEGMLADLYSTSASNPGFNWAASPACTELEAVVMDWAAKMLGLSPAFLNTSGVGGGSIQSTASDSALIAIVAARSLYQRTHPDAALGDLVIYTTTQTHSLGAKAGLILGLPVHAIEVSAADDYALRGEALQRALEDDARRGRRPFILIATVGTTSSGAIDNLTEIGDVVATHPSLWLHVDAAWAGVALACPELREKAHLAAINRHAHSFCTNFHKWGLTNFDASTLWVRDRTHLTDALDVTPAFLRTPQGDAGTVIDYRNWHLALGRRFRSLKLWFVLRSFGIAGFQEYIRKTIRLNEIFAVLVQGSPLFSLAAPPSLALTVFRLAPPAGPTAPATPASDAATPNGAFLARLAARTDIQLTQTVLGGEPCVRFAVGAARTEEVHVRRAFKVVCSEAEAVLAGRV